MRIVSLLAMAAVLPALAVQGVPMQADAFETTVLASMQDTPAPVATTPAPTTVTPAPDTTTPAPTTLAPSPTDAPLVVPEGGDDDELIGQLRPGEAVVEPKPVPEIALLADTASVSVTTSEKAKFPWFFTTDADASAGRQLVAASPPATTVPCTNAANLPDKGKFKVLVAVSSCFDKTSWQYIIAWVDLLEHQDARYFEGDTSSKIDVDVRTVDDGCDKPSWAPKLLKATDRGSYVAAINIMVFTRGCKTLEQFTAANKIQSVIGFVYNGPGPVVKGVRQPDITTRLPGYTVAPFIDATNGFLSQFNPFGAMRKIHCASLPGGVPTSYVLYGDRKCFCSCPVGTVLKDGACQSTTKPVDPITGDDDCTCAWSTKIDGYKLSSTAYVPSGICRFDKVAIQGTTGVLPVPVVVDNYVDHLRNNTGDAIKPLGSTPRIELTKSQIVVTIMNGKESGAENVTATDTLTPLTWRDFQNAPSALIDKLVFTRVGRYDVQLKATDYGSQEATCNACVLVVDSYRPSANPSAPCPKAVAEPTLELTKTNVEKVQKLVSGVVAFQSNALNDPCGLNTRCDEDSQQCKRFVDSDYSMPINTIGSSTSFFNTEEVAKDLRALLAGSPYDAAQPEGIAKATQPVCERCLKVSTILKEWWTDYKCGTAQASAQCEGSASCALTQCVRVNGTTLATASAALTERVKNASFAVAHAKESNLTETQLQTKYQLGTSVHIALECTKFPAADEPADAKCTYTTRVPDLIDIAASPAVTSLSDALLSAAELNSFVSWRYRVDAGSWRTWDTVANETFTKTETAVRVEAWTKCGQVQTFVFKVVLHLNSKIEVCERFPQMWYQATRETPEQAVNKDLLCMHPKSDFAEVTFDYHPNIGLAGGSFEMTIARVICTAKYDTSPDGGNATIVNVGVPPPTSYQIVKEFSIDGASVGVTVPETTVFVTCSFTYRRKLDNTTHSQVCNRKFVVKDCTPPKITKPCPTDGKCDYNKCANTKDVDLFQACGGNRISQAANYSTTITTAESQCCASCDTKFFTTRCLPIRETPLGATSDSTFIKRCEAQPVTSAYTSTSSATSTSTTAYGSYGSYSAYSVLEATVSDLKAHATETTSVLLGATAMVAVVALIVVRRRQSSAPAAIEEDAYYPLLG